MDGADNGVGCLISSSGAGDGGGAVGSSGGGLDGGNGDGLGVDEGTTSMESFDSILS